MGRNKSLCLFRVVLGLNPRAHISKQQVQQLWREPNRYNLVWYIEQQYAKDHWVTGLSELMPTSLTKVQCEHGYFRDRTSDFSQV